MLQALLYYVGGRGLWGLWMAPKDPGTAPRADPRNPRGRKLQPQHLSINDLLEFLESTTLDWQFVDIMVICLFHEVDYGKPSNHGPILFYSSRWQGFQVSNLEGGFETC